MAVSIDAPSTPCQSPRGVILVYHRISAETTPRPLSVGLSHFRQQLQVLTDGTFVVLSLMELAARALDGRLPHRAVAVTFDDGYANHLEETVRALERCGVPATFYIVGEALEPGFAFWWDIVDAVFSASRLPPCISFWHRSTRVTMATATLDERGCAQQRIKELFYGATRLERDQLTSVIVEWAGYSTRSGGPRPMTREELRQLAERPRITIGAHTQTHLWLPRQPVSDQVAELAQGRSALECVLRQSITSVAYPYGAHDRTTLESARKLGFEVGVTTVPALVKPGADPLALPRYEAADLDADAFRAFLNLTLS